MFQPVFIEHRGHKILRIDYSGLSLPDVVGAMQLAMKVIASEPHRSIRVLTLWDAPLSHESAEIIKRHVALNTPYIYASAVVTPRPLQKVFFDSMTVAGRQRLNTFDNEQQAKDWLAEQ